MRTLEDFIYESIEADNLLWMLDRWFDMHENEKQEFMEIIFLCQKDNNVNKVEEYINQTKNLKINYKEFISFMMDEVNPPKEIDYIYQFKEILKLLIGNKSNKNKYIKK